MTEPRRISRMGDSITVGYSTLDGGAFASEQKDPFVFVGTVPSADGAYEGHGGWRINQIASHVDGWLDATNPTDVALMIGTNDAVSKMTPEAALLQLRPLAQKIARRARLTLATIPPFSKGSAPYNAFVAPYNAGIVAMVADLQKAGYPVRRADIDARAITSDELLSDGVHPTVDGYKAIGHVMGAAVAAPPKIVSPTRASSSSEGVLILFGGLLALLALRKR